MTTSSRKSYNINALRGDKNIDDMDVVAQYGLDPAVAYTPKINEAAAMAQAQENERWYMKQGKSEAEAKALARNEMTSALATAKKLQNRKSG